MRMHPLLMGGSSGLPRNGLVALYDPYRDAYGLDATGRAALQTGVDYSGRGNTLTYGATTGASTDDPANTGTAWSLDGGDFLQAAHSATLDLGGLSCAVVFKRNATGVWETLFSKGNIGSGAGTALYFRNSSPYLRILFWTGGSTNYTLDHTSEVAKDVYHCVTLSMFTGAQAMYIDGVQVATGTTPWTESAVKNTSVLNIGYESSTGGRYFFNGFIPSVNIWNRPLSAPEHARIARTLKGMMQQRGLTPSW